MKPEYIIYRHRLSEGMLSSMVRIENFKEKDYVFYKPIDKYPHVQWWVHKDDLDIWKQLDSLKNESDT